MLHPSRSLHRYGACLIVALCAVTTACAEVVDVPLQNPSFEDGAADNGVPVGWSLYGGLSDLRKVQVIGEADEGAHALLISDDDPAEEVGIVQTVDCNNATLLVNGTGNTTTTAANTTTTAGNNTTTTAGNTTTTAGATTTSEVASEAPTTTQFDSETPTTTTARSLPPTGSRSGSMQLVALGLLLIGLSLVLTARRRIA